MKNIKVGFIGLGLMGNPMAKNIINAGFPLTVFNRTKKKSQELQKVGATIANSPADLAKEVDVVITMVTGPKDVKEVLLGNNGVVKNAKENLIVIDMSTVGPTAAVEIANELKKHNIDFLDAPVTGSVPKAVSGELTIFIGGNKNIFEKTKPVLAALGTNLQYIGPTGRGQAIKLINNLLIGSTTTALAEGFLLGDLLNLPREKVAEALKDVPAFSPYMKMKLPNIISNKFPTAFSVANIYKDLKLASLEVRKTSGNLPVLKLIEGLYKKANDSSLSQEDLSAIIKILNKRNNV